MSDLLLGAMGSRSDLVLGFLKQNCARTYLLVGDIIHGDELSISKWTASDTAVIDHLRARQKDGANLVHVRGDHDAMPETALGSMQLTVTSVDQTVHVARDGRRYLVFHGHRQDTRLFRALFLTRLRSYVDSALRELDSFIRRTFRAPAPRHRSFIEFLLSWANSSLYPSNAHERRLSGMAQEGGFDGVICGHFHIAALHERDGVTYANCGDWMDSFTALGLDDRGHLHLLGGRGSSCGQSSARLKSQLVRA